MAVKKCCIENCNSSSTRPEDIGVTYHKFPKETTLRGIWVSVTHYLHNNIDSFTYVCSRHFCKSDFQIYQDSKYVLKSDAVPSIFSWTINNTPDLKMDSQNTCEDLNREVTDSPVPSRKMSGEENLEAIRRYIENQEREIEELENQKNKVDIKPELASDKEFNESDFNVMANKGTMDIIEQGDKVVIATNMIDMILNEADIKKTNTKPKQQLTPKEKGGSSVALSVGSKVEVKDFSESWYAANIIEVDYEEMEVLVQYETICNKLDEWINVSSPRLRPFKSISIPNPPAYSEMEIKEDKQDDKTKLKYMIGERCLARWRDNRRFIATVCSDFGDGSYEVMFDDGAKWKCPLSRMYKLKESKSELTVDTSMSPIPSTPSPTLNEPGSSGTYPVLTPKIPFHKHLFDPTRDYLGSKSERREMKRKLNIKEIFNIGQKKQKRSKSPVDKVKVVKEKKLRIKMKVEPPVEDIKIEIKQEIPDAVASIIGTVDSENKEDEPSKLLEDDEAPKSLKEHEPSKSLKEDELQTSPQLKTKEGVEEALLEETPEVKTVELEIAQQMDVEEYEEVRVDPNEELIEEESMDTLVNNIVVDDLVESSDLRFEKSKEFEQVLEEETKLEKFDKPDESKQEVIEKMKEVINKLEDGLRVDSPKSELVIKLDKIKYDTMEQPVEKQKAKVKKSKRVKLQEKKVREQVKKVASDLIEMKKQMEQMKKNMLMRTEELSMGRPCEMPESYLLPGEWCCKWVNGQPVGIVSEVEVDARDGKAVLPRRSVQVEDKRLPSGWTKHIVRRSLGQSVGKWDVVLVSPDNRRIHTKTDMKSYLEHLNDETLKPYESVLLDFGVHLKLSRRMGWYQYDNTQTLPVDNNLSPLVINKRYRTKERRIKKSKKTKDISLNELPSTSDHALVEPETPMEVSVLEDGYVYVGSLKVQIIDTLLRCPAEGCFKNFRNNTLIQMHIKHYHPELREMLGATPKVLDLARERTKPSDLEPKPKHEPESKIIKVKIARPPKRSEEPKQEKETVSEIHDLPITKPEGIPRSQDSPKLRQALANKPVKGPKVLLPVRRPELEPEPAPELPPELEVEPEQEEEIDFDDMGLETHLAPELESLDFETAISTHTVTKPFDFERKGDKKRRCVSTVSKRPISEDDEWYGMNSDIETRSSFPGSGTPDSKTMDKPGQQIVSSESNEEPKDSDMYMFTETGERVKIERMKREEIINCHCGYREEDGLMVQCELCLCWQHALCHNIQREAEVPEKYTCSICLSPRRGRRSKRFLHDQDPLYEGLLPGAGSNDVLRRSHELSGNLLLLLDALHAFRVKYHVATQKSHPKLYLWAKDWENTEIGTTLERLSSDYSDLNIVNNIGKENLPVITEEVRESHLDMRTPFTDEFSPRDGSFLGLNTAMPSMSGASLDLPITTSELERLARSVQEISSNMIAPQPEAPIENAVCRERLLRHVQRSAALLDAKFDSYEALIAEMESQDPSFEDDETADYFPRTKQTIVMLLRDLDTMEDLGIIT